MLTRSYKIITINFITKLFFNRYENDVYDVILIMICRLSKMTLYLHDKSIWTTKNFANILFDRVFWRFRKWKTSFRTKIFYSRTIIDQSYVIRSKSNANWIRDFIRKSMNKRNVKIKRWNIICDIIVITNKTIELFYWRSHNTFTTTFCIRFWKWFRLK